MKSKQQIKALLEQATAQNNLKYASNFNPQYPNKVWIRMYPMSGNVTIHSRGIVIGNTFYGTNGLKYSINMQADEATLIGNWMDHKK